MATLAPSLKALFGEIDSLWPHRDRRTDGWIGDANHCPGTSDHCADSQGRVHAIDIDRDGVSTSHVIGRLTQYPGIIRYINHNGMQYHVRNNFAGRSLTGDPHSGWIHVSIERTDRARNYVGGYGIYRQAGVPGQPDMPEIPTVREETWDYAGHVLGTGIAFAATGSALESAINALRTLRDQ